MVRKNLDAQNLSEIMGIEPEQHHQVVKKAVVVQKVSLSKIVYVHIRLKRNIYG